jgi:recombinational DNA repair protein (RecF pathway)
MPHVNNGVTQLTHCANCNKTSDQVLMKSIEPVGLLCFRCWWDHNKCLNCGQRPRADAPSTCGCEDYRHGLSGEMT